MNSDDQARPGHPFGQKPIGSTLHPADWVVASGAVGDVLRELAGQLRRRRRRRAVTGAAVALVSLALAGFVWHQANPPTAVAGRTFGPSAVVSLPERQVLSDGSIVELRTGAQVEITFSDSARRVVLTRGEAHFQVAKMAKPFVVAAGGVEVRAVGTAFSVQIGSTQVEIMVTEGSVAVEPGAPRQALGSEPAETRASKEQGAEAAGIPREETEPPSSVHRPLSSALLVEAGNRVVVPTAAVGLSRPAVVPVETTELTERLAWRSPRLEFTRTPFSEALRMMGQHALAGTNVTVILAEPSLGRVEVSGVLRADNIDTLLRLLEDEHGFKTEYRKPREVVVRRGP